MMKRWIPTGLALIAVVLFMGFGARIDPNLVPSFEVGVAAKWFAARGSINFPMKGAYTINKFGRNQDSDTTRDSIWDGSDFGGPIRCFDVIGSTATAVYLSSDDENDASDNDAISITVEYLDGSWNAQSLSVALGAAVASGTTSVQITAGNILRINRMYPTSTAVSGNVYASTDADAGSDGIPDTILTQLVAVIDLLEQQTMQACYTVPNDFDCLLKQFCVGGKNLAANADATFRLQTATEGAASRTMSLIHIAESVHFCRRSTPPIYMPEKTDIELTNVSSNNNAAVSGTFDLLCLPNQQ